MPDADGYETFGEIEEQMFGPCRSCGHVQPLKEVCPVHTRDWVEAGCVFWLFTPRPGERNCVDCLGMLEKTGCPVKWFGYAMMLA